MRLRLSFRFFAYISASIFALYILHSNMFGSAANKNYHPAVSSPVSKQSLPNAGHLDKSRHYKVHDFVRSGGRVDQLFDLSKVCNFILYPMRHVEVHDDKKRGVFALG